MKPTQEQVIAWAREVELFATTSILMKFATLAYEAGRKDENEAAIEDARTVGGEAGAEMETLIRARREQ